MILKKVTFENKSDLEFIEKLYIESFPRNERRPILELHHLMEKESRFNVFLLEEVETNTRIGFVTYWNLATFIFIEHFAISPEQRNGGYGQKAIQGLIKQTSIPLVGEIELPTVSELASRRVKFYEKQGFKVWDLPYEQPAYEEGYDPIPMLAITYRDLNFPYNFEAVRDTIYLEVYKKKYK